MSSHEWIVIRMMDLQLWLKVCQLSNIWNLLMNLR